MTRQPNLVKERLYFPVAKWALRIEDAVKDLLAKGDRGIAIIREDTDEIISRASSDYELLEHKDVLEAVEKIFVANEVPAVLYDIFAGGRADNHMYANYVLEKDAQGMIPFLAVTNSYDGSSVFQVTAGLYVDDVHSAIRLPKRWYSRSLRHVGTNIDLSKVSLDVNKFHQALNRAKDRISAFRAIPLTEKLQKALLSQVFDTKKDLKLFFELEILETSRKQFGSTVHALFMALSYYATHPLSLTVNCRNYDKAVTLQDRLTEVFFNFDYVNPPEEKE